MTWKPRLVALDIDGTVVDMNGHLPEAVKAAVQRVVAQDVPVVLSTGRGWPGTQMIFDALELPPGLVVSANGAVVAEYPPRTILHTQTFDPRPVLERVRKIAPRALIGVDDGNGWRISEPFPEGELNGHFIVETFEQLAAREVIRVVVRDPQGNAADFHTMTQELGLNDVAFFIGWDCWLDIGPHGVDKAQGLAQVCDRLGIAAQDVLALGDGRNDIEMLRWAGRGVAMGDAVDEVKQAADHVTGTFAEMGTVAELDRWFAKAKQRVA